jgi:phage shock protein PspC (stress-responsive transcriptional regulator)
VGSAATRFHLSRDHKIVAGVAGGLADYTGASVGAVRLFFAGLAFLSGIGVVLYLIFWVLMPPAPEPVSDGFGGALRTADRVVTSGTGLLKFASNLVAFMTALLALAKGSVPLSAEIAQVVRAYTAPQPVPPAPVAPPPEIAALLDAAERRPAPPPARRRTPPRPRPTPAAQFAEPTPQATDAAELDVASLRRAVERAGQAEVDALRTVDDAPLHGVFVGEALNQEIAFLVALQSSRTSRVNTLVGRRYLSIVPDGDTALVRMVERWETEIRSAATGECQRVPAHDVPQTVHLTRAASGWLVHRIAFDAIEQPPPVPCGS